jgi:type VI secretion system protein ImpA
MASSEILDFTRLLEPIVGDNPAGLPLRADFSPSSIYYRIKDARAAARASERSMVFEEDRQQVGAPDWKPVLELGCQVLAEQSKDIEIAAWMTESLVRQYGYAGLRDGFRLLRELIERFWDNLYPLPDEDGLHGRLAPLAGLNGEGSDGVLIRPIFNVPLTSDGNIQALSYADYQQAADLSRLTDPDKRAQRISQGAITSQMFDQAILETSAEVLHNHMDDVLAALSEFEQLGAELDGRCGNDERGHSLAPPSSSIRQALESCRDLLQSVCQGRLPEEAADKPLGEEAADGVAPPEGQTKKMAGPIQSREDAFRSLLLVADFFKRTEPHSPISYALEQAVRWGRMSLPDLLVELIPEEQSRLQLFKLVGISPPEKPT